MMNCNIMNIRYQIYCSMLRFYISYAMICHAICMPFEVIFFNKFKSSFPLWLFPSTITMYTFHNCKILVSQHEICKIFSGKLNSFIRRVQYPIMLLHQYLFRVVGDLVFASPKGNLEIPFWNNVCWKQRENN